MRSVIENARIGAVLRFYVVLVGLDDREQAALRSTVEEAGRDATVVFSTFAPVRVRHLVRSKLITHATYARLFLAEWLPPEVHRCVYMDCDLVFERDVADLWETPLNGRTLGAVENIDSEDSREHQARLGLRRPRYLNAGVLLVDVDRWRTCAIGQKAVEFAERIGDRLILHDQDALNGALEDDWTSIDRSWNVWVIDPRLLADARAVFHFMGAPKPWEADYNGRFSELFFRHLDRTPFRGLRAWNPLGFGARLAKMRRLIPFLPAVLRLVRLRLASLRG